MDQSTSFKAAPFWDLVSAVIWIMSRNPADIPAEKGARNWLDLDLTASWHALSGHIPVLTREDAKRVLAEAFAAGDLECSALVDGVRQPVLALAWADIDIQDGMAGLELLHRPTAAVWREPLMMSAKVMKIWPAKSDLAAGLESEEVAKAAEDESEALPVIEAWPEVEDKADVSETLQDGTDSFVAHWQPEDEEEAEAPADMEQPSPQPKAPRAFRLAEARKWYAERVKQWTDSPRGPKAVDDYKLMKELFHLGRADARLVRDECAPDSWKQSGPKDAR